MRSDTAGGYTVKMTHSWRDAVQNVRVPAVGVPSPGARFTGEPSSVALDCDDLGGEIRRTSIASRYGDDATSSANRLRGAYCGGDYSNMTLVSASMVAFMLSKPPASAAPARIADWLQRKAELYDRLADETPDAAAAFKAREIAWNARRNAASQRRIAWDDSNPESTHPHATG